MYEEVKDGIISRLREICDDQGQKLKKLHEINSVLERQWLRLQEKCGSVEVDNVRLHGKFNMLHRAYSAIVQQVTLVQSSCTCAKECLRCGGEGHPIKAAGGEGCVNGLGLAGISVNDGGYSTPSCEVERWLNDALETLRGTGGGPDLEFHQKLLQLEELLKNEAI